MHNYSVILEILGRERGSCRFTIQREIVSRVKTKIRTMKDITEECVRHFAMPRPCDVDAIL